MDKILIVEDAAETIDLMSLLFGYKGYEVIRAVNGSEGISAIRKETPDLVTLDYTLPDMNGMEFLQKVNSWYKNPIIIVTASDTTQLATETIKHGAADFLAKPFEKEVLYQKVEDALKKWKEQNNHIFRTCNLKIDYKSETVKVMGEVIHLTGHELDVLNMLAEKVGEVVNDEDILKTVWGETYSEQHGYIRIFMSAIRKKITEKDPGTHYITTHYGRGHILENIPIE